MTSRPSCKAATSQVPDVHALVQYRKMVLFQSSPNAFAVVMNKKSGGQHSRSAAVLVHHNVCAVLLLDTSWLLLGWLVTGGSIWVSLVHLHVVVSAFLALALLLLIVFRVLDVNLFAAGFGLSVVVIGGACSILSTCHGGIFALGSDTLAFNFLLLLLLFFDAVLVSVGVEVGLRLLRRELGRCRFVGIPVLISFAQKSNNSKTSRTT
jgi:hypothetical protein